MTKNDKEVILLALSLAIASTQEEVDILDDIAQLGSSNADKQELATMRQRIQRFERVRSKLINKKTSP